MPNQDRSGLSRRAWLAAAAGTAATGLAMTRLDAVKATGPQEEAVQPQDPTRVPGRFVSEVGQRAPGEQRAAPGANSGALKLVSHAAAGITGHHHSLRSSLRAAPRGGSGDRAGRARAAGARDGRTAHGLSHARPPEVSAGLPHLLHRSVRATAAGAYSRDRMPVSITPQQLDGLLSTSEWTGVMLSTILREVGVRPGAELDPGRGQGRRGDGAQRAPGQGDGRRDARLRPERRSHPPGTGVSGASAAPGLGGQRDGEVAAADRGDRPPDHDPRRDIALHRSAQGRHGAAIQLRHGCEVDHHLPVIPLRSSRTRLVGDRGAGLDGTGAHHPGRGQRRRWAVLGRMRCFSRRSFPCRRCVSAISGTGTAARRSS